MTLHLRLALMIALLSAWLGAALLVAFSVAPAAFDVMPQQSAGDLIGRVLPVVFVSGLLISVFVAGLTAARARWRYALAGIMAVACGAARFVIDPRVAVMRAIHGTERPPEFATLHALSVGSLGVALAAALVLVILALRDLQRLSE